MSTTFRQQIIITAFTSIRVEFKQTPKLVQKHSGLIIIKQQLILGKYQIVQLELSEDVDFVVFYLFLLNGRLRLEVLLESEDHLFLHVRGIPDIG